MSQRVISRRRARALVSAAVLAGLGVSNLPALGDRVWDPNTAAGIQVGSGIWDFTTPNWTTDNGASNTTWQDSEFAFFGPSPTPNVVTVGGGPIAASQITFTGSGYTVNGDDVLPGFFGFVFTANPGVLGRVDANVAGTSDVTVNGGGAFYFGNNLNTFSGNVAASFDASIGRIFVDGAGTELLTMPSGLAGVTARGDATQLGQTNRYVVLQNGGSIKVIGNNYNPDGTSKTYAIGDGGGGINIASGFQQMVFDDANQIVVIGGGPTLTKSGNGRLSFGGQDYNLAADLNVTGGTLDGQRVTGGVANSRYSIVAAGQNVSVGSGGRLILNSGTVGFFDNPLTVNDGGIIGIGAGDNEFGARVNAGSITFNGTSTILSREAFGPQTGRLLRLQGRLQGNGDVNIIGTTAAGGNARIVFQGGGLNHTFTGQLILRNNTVLEANPRFGLNDSTVATNALGGSTFGSGARLVVEGFNAGLDLRDDGAAGTALNNSVLAYGNNITFSSAIAGNRPSLVVQRGNTAATAAAAGNVFSFGTLTIGNQWVNLTGAQNYVPRFSGASLVGDPTLDTQTATSPLQFDGAVNEFGAARTLVKIGASSIQASGAVNVSTVDVRGGIFELYGANGKINPGSVGGTGTVIVNGGGNGGNINAGVLLLNNAATGTTPGIASANSADRLADSVGLSLRGNSTLRLSSVTGGAGSTETTGSVSIPFGQPTLDVLVNGTNTAPSVLTLGSNPVARGTAAGVNFTGTGLGTAGNTARIILPGQGTTGFLGGWATSGNEFVKYSTTVDGGTALGVTPLVTADYAVDPAEAGYTTGLNVRKTTGAATTITLAGSRSVNSLALNHAALTANLDALAIGAGNTLTLESGGLIVATNASAIDRFATNKGTLTAGTTSDPSPLYLNANVNLALGATIANNAAGGAVTLVKNGAGVVSLTSVAAAPPNSFTGGIVVNNGTLDVWRLGSLGPNTNTVTLAGGAISLNVPNGTTSNAVIPGGGHNFVVEANSLLGGDNNGETGGAGTNNTYALGTLTINGPHWLTVGSFDSQDFAFTAANFSGTPTISPFRDGNSHIIVKGPLAGTGGFNLAVVANPGAFVLGGGSTDGAANTLTGSLNLYGGTLRVNKANGVNAIASDVSINGGTLAWGPAGDLGNPTNIPLTQPGFASGSNQIADTATITLLNGNLGINGQVQNETIGTLVQRGGTLNAGIGTLIFNQAAISGGNVAFNNGGTLQFNTLALQGGAPDLNVANDYGGGGQTILTIGAGGASLTGQNITLGTGTNNRPTPGGRLNLNGPLAIDGDPLNAGSYGNIPSGGISTPKGIFVNVGRELASNVIDLGGGNRTITVGEDVFYSIVPPIQNGGLVKAGGGTLVLQPYLNSTYAGPVTVNAGSLVARGASALGSAAGGTTIANGGTVKLDGGWTTAEAFTIAGTGGFVPGTNSLVREMGALVSETSTNRLTTAVTLSADATIASNQSMVPTTAAFPNFTSNLILAGGVGGTGTLTLGGNGDGTVAGVNVSGGLIKAGEGAWTLTAPGSFAGRTTVQSGTLALANPTGLGAASAAGNTVVLSAGTLRLQGGVTTAEPTEVRGPGYNGIGAIYSTSGNNALTAPVTLADAATIRSDGGLTVASVAATATPGLNRNLTLSGSGTGTVTGAIATGNAGLTKAGVGTWTLTGTNTFTGNTTASGGTLVLNYTGGGTRLPNGSTLNLAGGTVNFLGGGSQSFGTTGLNVGGGVVSTTGTAVDLGFLGVSTGGTIDFAAAAGFSASNSLNNGILGGFATVASGDWATLNGSAVAALAAYHPLASPPRRNGDNARVTGSQTQGGVLTTNSLKLVGPGGLNLGANALSLTANGVLYNGTTTFGIAGTGTLGGPTSSDQLILTVGGTGDLDLNVPLIGTGGGQLTKAGPGTATLSNTASTFVGNVNINRGFLAIAGPGGTTDATALGPNGPSGKLINFNGGGLRIITGAYDPGANGKSFVIGQAGGTVDIADGSLILNDANQLQGPGQLTKTGIGRLQVGQAAIGYPTFTGDTVINQGTLAMINPGALGGSGTSAPGGGRITLQTGATLILNAAGVVSNPITLAGGATLSVAGGDRNFGGPIDVTGTNTIFLVERDQLGQARTMQVGSRISGSGTLNVVGANNGNFLGLNSGSNDFTGTYNLSTNATVEGRAPGAFGTTAGQVTVNLNGVNSKLNLRHYLDGNYNPNVVVNASAAELSVDRLANNNLGTGQILSVNNLTLTGSPYLTVSSGNSYYFRTAGTASAVGGSPILNVTGNLLLDNGLAYDNAGGPATFDKRGGGTVYLLGAATHSGTTLVQAGTLWLRGPSTTSLLPNTSGVEIRGGTLTIDNTEGSNRLGGKPINLAGGTLRVGGAETLGTVAAIGGQTNVIYNAPSQQTASALTLTGFTVGPKATVNLLTEFGTLGGTTGNTANPRILIPTLNNGDIPGYLTYNTNDFVQYSTAVDGGLARGAIAVGYTTDPAETAYVAGTVLRVNATNITLTANRTVRAFKFEPSAANRSLSVGTSTLTIDNGGILGATTNAGILTGTTGTITAGTNQSNNQLSITVTAGTLISDAVFADNGATPIALVKSGGSTLSLRNTGASQNASTSTFTGGIFVNAGTLEAWRAGALGTGSDTVTLAGGTLLLNIPVAGTGQVLDQNIPIGKNIAVTANSILRLDNNAELADAASSTDNNMILGGLSINGPYTLQSLGFQSYDAVFQNGAALNGTPTFDMVTNDAGHTLTIAGAITGTGGYYVTGTGGTANGTLEIGGGVSDTVSNTNTGTVTVLAGNSPILRLNKGPGAVAIAGDLVVNGGTVQFGAGGNQIADTSTVTVNAGTFTLNGQPSETIGNLVLNGGLVTTGTNTGAIVPTLTFNNLTVNGGTGDGLQVNGSTTADTNGGRINVTGTLTVNDFGRVLVIGTSVAGKTTPTLDVNNVVLNGGGNVILNNGAGANDMILRGTVTSTASALPAGLLSNGLDTDTFLDLDGVRTFDVADGPANVDFLMQLITRNNGATAGGLTKTGPGVLLMNNTANSANTYTGGTNVFGGVLALARANTDQSVPAGTVTIGDGVGGARADVLRLLASNQISDAANLVVASSGLLDLQTINASDTISTLNVAVGGVVEQGPGSVLTVGGAGASTISGSIIGQGAIAKAGTGTMILASGATISYSGATNVSGGTLRVNAVTSGQGSYSIASGATLGGSGTIGLHGGATQVLVQSGGTLAPGNSPGILTVLSTGTPQTGAASTVVLAAGSNLNIEVNGPAAGTGYDQLAVVGTVDITGSNLLVSVGYTPTNKTDLHFLISNDGADPIGGTFATLNGSPLSGPDGQGLYTAVGGGNEFVLSYTGNLATNSLTGGNDLVIQVPEPAGAVLAALAGLGLLTRRRRTRA